MKCKTKGKLSAVFLICVIFTAVLCNTAAAMEIYPSEPTEKALSVDEVPAILDYEEAAAKGHVERLYSEEEELNTVVFRNADDTNSMYLFDEDVKYEASDGKIYDKSNKLIKEKGGDIINPSNDIKIRFPYNINAGVTVQYQNYKINLTPENKNHAKAAELKQMPKKNQADHVTYRNVFGQGTKLVYSATFSGMKEDIVLDAYTGIYSFSFELKTFGLHVEKIGDVWKLTEPETQKPVFDLGKALIYDAAGKTVFGTMDVVETVSNQKYLLTLTAPEEFLTAADTVYPVTVDPMVNVGYQSILSIQDASIYTENNQNAGGLIGMHVGYTSFNGMARGLVLFPGLYANTAPSSFYNEGRLISVKYNFAYGLCTYPTEIYAYLLKEAWSENEVAYTDSLWNTNGSTYIGRASIPVASGLIIFPRAELDITAAYEMWQKGTENHGIILKLADENAVQNEAVFILTKENGQEGMSGYVENRPHIVVNYAEKFVDGGIYKFKQGYFGNNGMEYKYLTVAGGYDATGRNVIQYAPYAEANNADISQLFRVKKEEDCYKIYPVCSAGGHKRALGVASLSQNANVLVQNNGSGDNQLFQFVFVTDTAFYIRIKTEPGTHLALTTVGGNVNGSNGGTGASSTGNVILSSNGNQVWTAERYDGYHELYYQNSGLRSPFRDKDNGSDILNWHISDSYGYRVEGKHGGLDIIMDGGTPLYSPFKKAKVITVGEDHLSMGNYIIFEAADDRYNVYGSTTKLRIIYMHLKEIASDTNPNLNTPGHIITENEIIGLVGTTGDSTGNHLHYTINIVGTSKSNLESTTNPSLFYPNITYT